MGVALTESRRISDEREAEYKELKVELATGGNGICTRSPPYISLVILHIKQAGERGHDGATRWRLQVERDGLLGVLAKHEMNFDQLATTQASAPPLALAVADAARC
jgi:hypothetical protein